MQNLVHSELFPLRTMHCDVGGRLSLHSLFLFLQEVATSGAERLGFGRTFVEQENMFWVVSRIHMRMYEPPVRDQVIEAYTWADTNMRYIFPRYYQVVDVVDARPLVEAASYWVLVDADKREIVFPSQRGYEFPAAPAGMPKLTQPGKLTYAFSLDREEMRQPKYSDFDMNGHMNNARYPQWIADLFELGRFRTHYIDEFQLNFVKEILWGETVTMRYGEEGDAFAVRGLVGEELRFEAQGHFARLDG